MTPEEAYGVVCRKLGTAVERTEMSDSLIWCDLCSTMVSPSHECDALRFQGERDAALKQVAELQSTVERLTRELEHVKYENKLYRRRLSEVDPEYVLNPEESAAEKEKS